MFKSSSIFKRNGAHLVGKMIFEKKRIVHFRSLSVSNMQFLNLFVSNFEHVKTEINEKYSQKKIQSKLLCSSCDFSNIQKCNVKKCPLTWVVFFTMILPISKCKNYKKNSNIQVLWWIKKHNDLQEYLNKTNVSWIEIEITKCKNSKQIGQNKCTDDPKNVKSIFFP